MRATASFLKLSPVLAVVTNLDREHMDCYRDMADVEGAFVEFMDRRAVLWGDDGVCGQCAAARGAAAGAAAGLHVWRVVRMRIFGWRCWRRRPKRGWPLLFEVNYKGLMMGPFALHVPGRHNVLNATAAVAIGVQLGVAPDQIAAGLESFRGVDRRFQIKGSVRGVTVVDDYGHHPTEILATLQAARDAGYGRVHVLFQPHRYTRTRDLHGGVCAGV